MPGNTRNTPKVGRGRRSGIEEARSLVALLGALSTEGDTISVDAIASRMGVSQEEAQKLLELVMSAGGEDGNYLSLYSDDNNTKLTLTGFGRVTKGHPLKLTDDETRALNTAFDSLGLSQDDPLREKVASSYASSDIKVEDVSRSLATASTSSDEKNIATCSEALAESKNLSFLYQGVSDETPRKRSVYPEGLRRGDHAWYLDAVDLENDQSRTFRIDRMSDLNIVSRKEDGESGHLPQGGYPTQGGQSRVVLLHFYDPKYLSLFEWPGLSLVSKKGHRGRNTKGDTNVIDATIPYFGKGHPWLVRHIAACRGTVTTEDVELAQEVEKYVREMLTMY